MVDAQPTYLLLFASLRTGQSLWRSDTAGGKMQYRPVVSGDDAKSAHLDWELWSGSGQRSAPRRLSERPCVHFRQV